jgi:hypothetical protein
MPESPSPNLLEYAGPGARQSKPTHHSALAGWAWGMLIIEVIYRGSVCAYAYHRSPTWTWIRFDRTVGNPEVFIGIDQTFFLAGALLAVLALIPRDRKRWAAWAALVANLWSLANLYPFLELGRRALFF